MFNVTASFQAPDLILECRGGGIEVPTVRLRYLVETISDLGDLGFESGPLKLVSSSCRAYEVRNH